MTITASYPVSIKSFLTYQDQPPGSTSVIAPDDPTNPTPGTPYDLTIDRAYITNEIHSEVLAMEQNIGVGANATIVVPGITTMGGEINFLYNNKANGRVDPSNNAIYASVTPTHNHTHAELRNLDADDHTQYVLVDGARGFSAPVAGVPAAASNQLMTLGQLLSQGWLNSAQAQYVIDEQILAETGGYPVRGPAPQPYPWRYRMTGGYFWGQTDESGLIRIDYSAAAFIGILSIVYMKMPFPGVSVYGYVYQYEEDQLMLIEIDNSGCTIQFTEDIVIDRQAWVSMCWMVVGV
jgi:hypothetical protein